MQILTTHKYCKVHNNGKGALLPIEQFYSEKHQCKDCEKAKKREAYAIRIGITEDEKQRQKVLNQRWRKNDEIHPLYGITYYGHWD